MKLLFESDPPYARWCLTGNGSPIEKKCLVTSGWEAKLIKSYAEINDVDAVGYFLHHGGEGITSSTSLLSPQFIRKVERSIRFLPEHNGMTLRIAQSWMERLPKIPHVVLCDTALFSNLPLEVSTYAVPYKLRKAGIRRYGGDGICHEWAWARTKSLFPTAADKTISVHLGNLTNVAAIKNGIAVETSIGFTPTEGIISPRSCGDIDPTIIVQLISAGMSVREINKLLSNESGFTGLLGRECVFDDINRNAQNPETVSVRKQFGYALKKYIGAFVAVLGGVDAIVFTGERIRESIELISEVCRSCKCLGLQSHSGIKKYDTYVRLSSIESKVNAICLDYNKWNAFDETINTFLRKEN